MYTQSDQTKKLLRKIADNVHDSEILQKLDQTQTIAYHKTCYTAYQTTAKRCTEVGGDSTWHHCRRVHRLAFKSIFSFIECEIFENSEVMNFRQLFGRYKALLLEFGDYELNLNFEDYSSEKFEKKLLKREEEAEELETEMTYTSVQENGVIPTGITAVNGCSTHVAFDNFVRFVDTTSGKDTMHDTVGIRYQFPCFEFQDIENSTNSTSLKENQDKQGPHRKRRRFSVISREVPQYFQKPKIGMHLFPVDSINNRIDVGKGATEIAILKDVLWIMSLSQLDSVAMWLGYNCMVYTDHSEIENIEYLPQIYYSPTSYAIVNETLNIASEIAEKCQQNQIIVTYDLAFAKMAMQIQNKEKPKFVHIFINLGAFHMQMAFFNAVGKFIHSSGLIDVLVSAEVLAPGSANSFLDSKHFNRCKRLHPVMSAALQICHFKKYLSTTNVPDEMVNELLQAIIDKHSKPGVNEPTELPYLLNGFTDGYNEYCNQTLMGNHGKTA